MAFFKSFRDQLKVNALISHLEFARDRFPHDQQLGLNHLAAALKALVEIKSSESERALTFSGWKHVVTLSTTVSIMVKTKNLHSAGKDCEFITEHALKWRDEAFAREDESGD